MAWPKAYGNNSSREIFGGVEIKSKISKYDKINKVAEITKIIERHAIIILRIDMLLL
jgi:hypothetical protein